MKSKIKLALLATTAVLAASLTSRLSAQSAGDLVIAFEASGAATNVEVDLGNVSNFVSGSGLVANINTDLTNAFTASWNTNTALNWGVVGSNPNSGASNGFPNKTIWVTGATGDASGYTNSPSVNYGTVISKMTAIYGAGTGGLKSGGTGGVVNLTDITSQTNAVTGANVIAAISTPTGNAAAFTNENGANSFGGVGTSNVTTFLVAENAGGGTTSLDLYTLATTSAGAAAVDLGTFSLDSSGNLTFTAIPEPSMYAAILGAITVGFVMLRRRNQVTS